MEKKMNKNSKGFTINQIRSWYGFPPIEDRSILSIGEIKIKTKAEYKIKTIKLKRCPFCGGKAVMRNDEDGWPFIMCSNFNCHAKTLACADAQWAAEIWNRRV